MRDDVLRSSGVYLSNSTVRVKVIDLYCPSSDVTAEKATRKRVVSEAENA